jgi:hypothetical protein
MDSKLTNQWIVLNSGSNVSPACQTALVSFERAFNQTIRPEYTKDLSLFDIDTTEGTSPFLNGEYADYLNFDTAIPMSMVTAGHDLGVAAAVLYNVLVRNSSLRKGHRAVSRVTMTVNSVVHDGGMEYNREGKGWIAFRMLYGSASNGPE